MSALLLAPGAVVVGNDAGWHLRFLRADGGLVAEFGRDDYHAEITATLPAGLEGGEYRIEVEGVGEADYAKVSQAVAPERRATRVELYLFWRDTRSVLGYLANVAGVTDLASSPGAADLAPHRVAVLAITSLKRVKGSRRPVMKLEAREAVFEDANGRPICGEFGAEAPLALAARMARDAGIDVVEHALPAAADPAVPSCAPERGQRLHAALGWLAARMEESSGLYGRGQLLVRDGRLHIGPRPIPLLGGEGIALHAGNGLLESESLAAVEIDPGWRPCDHEGRPSPTRRQFRLLLKGRADLKPGDVVRFKPSPGDGEPGPGHWTGALGESVLAIAGGQLLPGFGETTPDGSWVSLYVATVAHRLGRTSGFQTTVTGVALGAGEDGWDRRGDERRDACVEPAGEGGSAAARAAAAQRRLVERTLAGRAGTEVAEVRATHGSGSAEPPSQTVTLWKGLVNGDGGVHQSRRLAPRRPSDQVSVGAPCATPFAWGRCGLVVPRYPGTRVVVTHRGNDRGEPIDIGALWESGQGPDSQPGDWWLGLPAEIPANRRASLADDAEPQRPSGKASNDLIDADGNRVIEVGSFTLRFTRDGLHEAGERPAAGTPDAVTIEHAGGDSRIRMNADGSIEITGKGITLDAGTGDIVLRAGAVKVE